MSQDQIESLKSHQGNIKKPTRLSESSHTAGGEGNWPSLWERGRSMTGQGISIGPALAGLMSA